MAEDLKLERLEYLIGEEKIRLLKSKTVTVCGCGGVGSFVAEALARSGVGRLILVDFDRVDISNLNRQLMTDKDNVGLYKADVLKERLEKVSDCKVNVRKEFIDENFIIDECDYVADCIDTLSSKFALVKKAHEAGIPIISALGSAKRLKPERIMRTTLDKTSYDPLAKAFRNIVKKEGYRHKIDVVYSKTEIIESHIIKEGETRKEKYPLGSAVFTVGSVGLYLAEIIFEELIKE